ncbi:MAG: sugar kinase [Clostridia bacterium]|nr:sugar kinase [Clostridia bacterium]
MGEVMLRLSPSGKERISHCETFEKRAGGSELNVVSGISLLGMRTAIITKLPKSEIGEFARRKIRYHDTSDDYILYDDSPTKRLGIYYYESGAYPRLPTVVYDRAASSFTTIDPSELPSSVYSAPSIFHTSGITLALSESVKNSVISVMERFHESNTAISFDVNYRSTLWDEDTARRTVESILPYVSILFVSEETSRRMFGMNGTLENIHGVFAQRYPNLKVIASTRRAVISAERHSFSSFVTDCEDGEHFEECPYENIEVVDRIGSGDAYVAGALYALLRFRSIEKMALYGDAMAALKSTVLGDMTECSLSDVERIISVHSDGGPKSEMIR